MTEAIRSGLAVAAILASESGEKHLEPMEAVLKLRGHQPHGQPLLPTHHARRTQILRTTDRLFDSVTGTKAPQGIAALVTPRSWAFDDLLVGGVALVVILAGVQDPGNVGTILRSAEAFGATRSSPHRAAPSLLPRKSCALRPARRCGCPSSMAPIR